MTPYMPLHLQFGFKGKKIKSYPPKQKKNGQTMTKTKQTPMVSKEL